MNTIKKIAFLILVVFTVQACGVKVGYNFTGGSTGDAKSFQVNFFQNYAAQNAGSTVEPGLDRDFTEALRQLLTNQTSLDFTNTNGDLIYEGEIIEYRISPMTATAEQKAAQNRLTMVVKVRFFNNTKEEVDFEQSFSHFFDYDANKLLQSVKDEAHKIIFDRITQNIFSKSLADW